MTKLLACTTFVILLLVTRLPRLYSSSVSINLYAKWRYTPLHLETSEFLSNENKEYFWNYIDKIHEWQNSSQKHIHALDYEQNYQKVVDIAHDVIGDKKSDLIQILKFSLAHRTNSPAIAAHEQIAHDRLGKKIHSCEAFLEFPQPPIKEQSDKKVDGKIPEIKNPYNVKKLHIDVNVICNSQDANIVHEKIISTPDYLSKYYQPTIYKSDHIYYAKSNPKAKDFKIMTVVLYGDIGTESFVDLYNFCIEKANNGIFNFVVRHLASRATLNTNAESFRESSKKPRVSLGGYGIELAIKSTEYKAQDDTRIKGEATNFDDASIQDSSDHDDTWDKKNKHFGQDVFEQIKVVQSFNSSDLHNLSAQAISLILSVSPELKRLNFMKDLNQNFPAAVSSVVKKPVDELIQHELDMNQLIFARYLSLAPTDSALFMNGLYFDVDALDMFALFEVVRNELKDLEEGTADVESDVERFLDKHYKDKHTKFVIEPRKPDEIYLKMQVILDPLTRGAQKVIPILITLHDIFNIRIRFMFNCVDKHTEMPLKNFFRFVIEKEPKFRNGPDNPPSMKTVFNGMPISSLLTLNLATPENWLVESVKSPYDLDNIHIAQIPDQKVHADFELEHLLLEGHCFDITTGSPPRGLQFVLGTQNHPAVFDTIVMANLGYFQLKASPGAWNLRLRHGKSNEIYTIFHVDGADFVLHQDKKLSSESMIPALLIDFRSRFMKLRVHKKRDQRHRDLLSDEGEEEKNLDIWESIRNTVWPVDGEKNETELTLKPNEYSPARTSESNRINIFSLASGHLYERLARIMMLSVLKHTSTPVKFWFLKNYLSPSFKDFLPYMAEKYNFDFEFVQYKWPRWLHQQSEKQRIIWGYKILFLDVLFPLDVKKIIFVDADQVVRTDLKELRDLDLGGAPYGYTPFCESRTDMDGYRFWKSGYWRNHLHNRKYHISALYVVDLIKFRKIAAGDRLRGQYQGLSQDPNSLSNLDQDLPNNMIHQVKIKSLPQEWLWCETWCSNEEKEKAKTIDLCNNPQTKEPKLTAARRIVKEWQDYDDEIKAVYEEFVKSQQRNSSEKAPFVDPPASTNQSTGKKHDVQDDTMEAENTPRSKNTHDEL